MLVSLCQQRGALAPGQVVSYVNPQELGVRNGLHGSALDEDRDVWPFPSEVDHHLFGFCSIFKTRLLFPPHCGCSPGCSGAHRCRVIHSTM